MDLSNRYELIAVLQRFNKSETIYDQPISKFCIQQGLDPNFIELITDAFHHPDSFCPEKMQSFEPEIILEYLEKTHAYYLNKLIPEIEQRLIYLVRDPEISNKVAFKIFEMFRNYQRSFTAHIKLEEEKFFPFVRSILKGEKSVGYSLEQFQKDHIHQEEELAVIRDFIIKFYPETGDQMPFEILLRQLDLLERDIEVHAKIEDEVLVKMVGY